MGKLVSAFTNDVLGNLDATGIADAIAKGQISVKEATEAAISRAECVNGELNAIVIKTYEDARRNGALPYNSPFYGVPAFIKDNDNIKGYPTQMGTGAFKAQISDTNGRFVDQFLSTGVNNLGKSTMPEFGLLCSAENEKWGITRNPWNTDYTPGGSSSGSAALVASGVVPIATANDGAGSIRIPAACCGLVGLKPTRGRLVFMDGTEMMPLNIVYEGVLTRSVRDTATFYEAAERFYRNPKLPHIGKVNSPVKERLRFAFFENQPEGKPGHIDDDTYRVQLETAKLLESLGHKVEQIKIPLDIESVTSHFLNYYGFFAYILSYWGLLIHKAEVDLKQLETFTTGLSRTFLANAIRTPNSVRIIKSSGEKIVHLVEGKYDLLMTPVTARTTPEIGYFSPDLPYEEISRRAADFAPYTGLQNVTGSPSISLPLGTTSTGMPVGVQFTAAHGNEKLLLELAYEMEAAKPWKQLFQA